MTSRRQQLPFQRLDRTVRFPYSRREYLRRIAWEVIRWLAFRFTPPRADRWRAGVLRLFGAKLGRPVTIRPTVLIRHPWLLQMEEWSTLSDRVQVYNLGLVSVGSHTVVSQDVYLCAGTHDYTQAELPLVRSRIKIGHGVWICAGVFVGPDVEVGDNAVVGARAVVVRDVAEGVIAAGNPARTVSRRRMIVPDTGNQEGDISFHARQN